MSTLEEMVSAVTKAFQTMSDMPGSLGKALNYVADLRGVTFSESPLHWLEQYINQHDDNDNLCHAIGLHLRTWDRADGAAWTGGTKSWTEERRKVIAKNLGLPEGLQRLFESRFAFFRESDRPVVVADEHKEWYSEARKLNRFYWQAYSDYLLQRRKWTSQSIAKLDDATDAVVQRLSDPCRPEAFQAKGLVVGYVQSGKTAHFTGVLAKAADAGYRFIIVMTGTIDILRQQTQRRVDKELVGKELLGDEYSGASDWKDFLSHGGLPSALGAFDWQRLTGIEDDYAGLERGIAALEFKPIDPSKRFNDEANLRRAAVSLVIIKKNPAVLRKLAADLAKLKHRLDQVPALLIDDESDQASINTVNPDKETAQARTATNDEITKLLKVLPRAQYVGYTATPFANVLVNPWDDKDLFPKDFIVALPRPEGYMGVADFHDLGETQEGFRSNQRAFVRDVRGADELPVNLQKAIDSFVLAGAVKCFRERKGVPEYRHHTMLVHHATKRQVHQGQAEMVRSMFESGGYLAGSGIARLRKLFDEDFGPVSRTQAPKLPNPKTFGDLQPYIGRCIQRISADMPVRIVNGDNKDQTPDFDQGPVWSILVGGAKLSRGYTVEGLTTTYFRRVSSASDTLMQMGRWFGFRAGYRDLVRLFIGRAEHLGKRKEGVDLYESFRAICLDEEEFRGEIKRYVDVQGIKPIDVHPLIPSHLAAIRPTSRNKMFHSTVTSKNFGDSLIERTVVSFQDEDMRKNADAAEKMLKAGKLSRLTLDVQRADGKVDGTDAIVWQIKQDEVLRFLRDYRWRNHADVLALELKFLGGKSQHGDPGIRDWLVIAPQLKSQARIWPPKAKGDLVLTVKERAKHDERFAVYSEPSHVTLAKLLVGIDVEGKTLVGRAKGLSSRKQAVMLFYPVVPLDAKANERVSIGFAIQLPRNDLPKKVYYTARGTRSEQGGR